MTGVALLNEEPGCQRKRYVHNEADTWEITSDSPIDRVPEINVLDRCLPGRLGSFIYPMDAVFTLKHGTKTTCADLKRILLTERSQRSSQSHLNHISVSEHDTVPEENNASDDEDEESETDEDDVDENCEGEEGDGEWDDEEED